MGFRGSNVQIISSRPESSRAYEEIRKPFFFGFSVCVRYVSAGAKEGRAGAHELGKVKPFHAVHEKETTSKACKAI
ncbi:uncharacterized protein DFE_2396 [Desulfovibrio ferrophilus]|uniref:Uncharacterized protein n=1 Tax=Desulfovibrio ferrophilus TaxID=241368 RepID=A0A2Z6B0U0_9BACT|nr:uncharacterized protein DFE_2396 [Desulfovibrio ferrophilus]